MFIPNWPIKYISLSIGTQCWDAVTEHYGHRDSRRGSFKIIPQGLLVESLLE